MTSVEREKIFKNFLFFICNFNIHLSIFSFHLLNIELKISEKRYVKYFNN
jgi:hypothetical protein